MSSTSTATTPPLPFDLVSMYQELSVVPHVDIVNVATRTFLTQNQKPSKTTPVSQGTSDTNEPGSDNVDTQGASLTTGTLLKLLFGDIDTEKWSPERLRRQRDNILAGETAVALGQALYSALSLDPDRLQPGPALFSQLTWCALLFELEPPRQRRYSHMAGLDLCSPNMTGKKLRRELVRHLKSKARTADGLRSTDEARLAVSLLEPLYPELARNDLPSTLYCGSLAWSNLTHAIALSEALRPGSSLEMDRQQLENRLLEASQTTDEEELSIIAATCIRPALHWAVIQGKVVHREDGNYSEADLAHAQATLDARRNSAARAVEMLFSNIPDRLEMARQKLREAYADTDFLANYMPEWPLTPTTLGKKLKYFAHGHVDWKSNGRTRFNMLELFTSGHTIKGIEDFSADAIENKTFGGYYIPPDLDKLRGIDLPALFDEAFDKYWESASAGYEFLIEALFEQLPSADRDFFKQAEVWVCALREQKTFPAKNETKEETELLRGRMGFIVTGSIDRAKTLSYEVFPLQGLIVRRPDLNVFTRWAQAQRHLDIRHPMAVDWQAYHDGRAPIAQQTADLVPVILHYFRPGRELSRNLQEATRKIVAEHMFFDRDRLYSQQRGKTFFEEVDDLLPFARTVWSVFIPGLGCYNALRTNKSTSGKIVSCALDIASILVLPAVGLAGGALKLARLGGQIAVSAKLSALAGLTGKFLKASAKSYVGIVNPFHIPKPSYVFGLLRYNGSNRRILALSRISARVAAEARLRRAFSAFLSLPELPTEYRIRNVRDLDIVLEKHKIFGSAERLHRQRRQEILDLLENGAEVKIHTRPDGTKTLITPDEITASQVTYIDLANNLTVRMSGFYDYRQLRSWRTFEDSHDTGVINVSIDKVTATPSSLNDDQMASVRKAMELGVLLPALDVTEASGSYHLVNGYHRLQAAKDLGMKTVPVKIAPPGQTTVVTASQLGYIANYGLHVRGLLVVPAVLAQTPSKHGPGQTPSEPEVPDDYITEEQRALLRNFDFDSLRRSTWVN